MAGSQKNSGNRKILKALFYIVAIGYGLISLFPFIWGFYSSFKPARESFKFFVNPNHLVLENYLNIFKLLKVGMYYKNSIIVAIIVVTCSLLINSLAGYSLARIRFPGRELIFIVILGVIMIPGQVLLVPIYVMLAKINWLNSYLGLTIPFVFSSVYIFMMRQFFRDLPVEMEEAAFIDGMGRPGIFFKIALPLVKPALATQAIFLFIGSWNSFLWPSIISTKREMFTITVGLYGAKQAYPSLHSQLMAAAMLMSLPTIAVFLIFQKFIIKGISTAGIKA